MKLATVLLLVSFAHAQGFYGAGLSALPSSQPHPSGWAAFATSVSTKADLYSISEMDYTRVPGPRFLLQNSLRTGLASTCHTFGPRIKLYCLIDAGVATTGYSASMALGAGGVAIIQPKKHSDFVLTVAPRLLRSPLAGTQQTWSIGFG